MNVDFDNQEARVQYDAKRATIELMSAALQGEGYQGSQKSEPVPLPGG